MWAKYLKLETLQRKQLHWACGFEGCMSNYWAHSVCVLVRALRLHHKAAEIGKDQPHVGEPRMGWPCFIAAHKGWLTTRDLMSETQVAESLSTRPHNFTVPPPLAAVLETRIPAHPPLGDILKLCPSHRIWVTTRGLSQRTQWWHWDIWCPWSACLFFF